MNVRSRLLLAAVLLSASVTTFADVHVRATTTKKGQTRTAHTRTNPDHTRTNNYSTKGNVNPYTGKKGTKKAY